MLSLQPQAVPAGFGPGAPGANDLVSVMSAWTSYLARLSGHQAASSLQQGSLQPPHMHQIVSMAAADTVPLPTPAEVAVLVGAGQGAALLEMVTHQMQVRTYPH